MRLLLASLVTALAIPVALSAQGRATAVTVQPVETRLLSETVPVFAEIKTSRDGTVASRVAGTVETVHVLDGSTVAMGDPLIDLDDELLRIQLAQSEAELAVAQASIATAEVRLDRAETTFARIEALRDSATFSQGRFDDAQSDVLEAQSQMAEAQARVKSVEARMAEARYQLERSVVTAPFSGVVIDVNVIPGQFIAAGTAVVRLLDTDAFEVQASVPARYIATLQPGQEMVAQTEAGEDLTLRLRAVLPVEEASTRTRKVLFSAPALGDLSSIAEGQSVTVQIPVGAPRNLLSVPKDALVQARGGWTVFVAEDGKAQPRNVTLGLPVGDRYEVTGGLAEGDLVVVRGNERLRPGQDITPNLAETN
ncbi:efflux RND transporter periplasmic adaptor subunit [Aestuariivita boseongensis]|uniref:efflux RND transporter periplasmic adaptor subunit n=1 Tax=Aestuariivita boseongensis TaxID=1470562 RepID=UPI0006835115|nr:efflux RND transporter periplasmic adaptor subunit [Aestuariivita boseongensis]